jgi:hypothetical protein
METPNYSPKSSMQFTRIIYFALIVGLILFLIVALYLSSNSLAFKIDSEDPFTYVVLLTMVVIPIGYIYSNKIFKSYKPNSTIKDRLPIYQQGIITRLSFCNGLGLFSVVCLLISSNLYYVIFVAIALAVMIINYPTPEKIGEAVDLTSAEIELLVK